MCRLAFSTSRTLIYFEPGRFLPSVADFQSSKFQTSPTFVTTVTPPRFGSKSPLKTLLVNPNAAADLKLRSEP